MAYESGRRLAGAASETGGVEGEFRKVKRRCRLADGESR
jgi:hypothetical protein